MSSKIIGCGANHTLDTPKVFIIIEYKVNKNHVRGLVGGTTVNENLWEGLNLNVKEEIGDVDIKKKIIMETSATTKTFYNAISPCVQKKNLFQN